MSPDPRSRSASGSTIPGVWFRGRLVAHVDPARSDNHGHEGPEHVSAGSCAKQSSRVKFLAPVATHDSRGYSSTASRSTRRLSSMETLVARKKATSYIPHPMPPALPIDHREGRHGLSLPNSILSPSIVAVNGQSSDLRRRAQNERRFLIRTPPPARRAGRREQVIEAFQRQREGQQIECLHDAAFPYGEERARKQPGPAHRAASKKPSLQCRRFHEWRAAPGPHRHRQSGVSPPCRQGPRAPERTGGRAWSKSP